MTGKAAQHPAVPTCMTSSLHLEGVGFEGLETLNPKALQTVHEGCAHLHDQLSALGESLFCLLDRDVLDGSIQLLLQRFVVGLLQHLLEGAERHCDGGWQVDLLWQLASQACTAVASSANQLTYQFTTAQTDTLA